MHQDRIWLSDLPIRLGITRESVWASRKKHRIIVRHDHVSGRAFVTGTELERFIKAREEHECRRSLCNVSKKYEKEDEKELAANPAHISADDTATLNLRNSRVSGIGIVLNATRKGGDVEITLAPLMLSVKNGFSGLS